MPQGSVLQQGAGKVNKDLKAIKVLESDLREKFLRLYSEMPVEWPLFFKPFTEMKLAGCRGPDFGYFRYRG